MDDEVSGHGNNYTAVFWQYDTRLARRWNIDPVVKEFRSSYDAFSNNPIIMIDPNGATNYYNRKGKWLGTDGVENGLLTIVTSNKIKRDIKRNTKKGLNFDSYYFAQNGLKTKQFMTLSVDIMSESVKVLELALSTSKTKQEHTAVMIKVNDNGFKTIDRQSPPVDDFNTSDGEERVGGGVLVDGDVSIHSHPTDAILNKEGTYDTSSATKRTSYDEKTNSGDEGAFTRYGMKIIVNRDNSIGNLTTDQMTGKVSDSRPLVIAVYGGGLSDTSEPKMVLDYGVCKKMVNSNKNNKRINNFFTKKGS